MELDYTSLIQGVRRFNRFYTNVLGLLEQHMLSSDYSLSEVRVLYEIGCSENCTAKQLIEELKIDPGYLSRIVKRFEKCNYIERIRSKEDGRLYYLHLTEQGKEILEKLDKLSNEQIAQLLERVPKERQKHLIQGMETIEELFSKRLGTQESAFAEKDISIRSELKAGDIGYLIHLHGWIYAKECGYNYKFESYVCKTFYDFFENYKENKDKFWFAECNGEIIGAIAIVERSVKKAQLRWFILHPKFREKGLGKTLLHKALEFCREKKYESVYLETTEDQKTAIKMYTKAGFKKINERKNNEWGKKLIEQTYKMNL